MVEVVILVAAFRALNQLATRRGHRGPWWGAGGVLAYLVASATIGHWLAEMIAPTSPVANTNPHDLSISTQLTASLVYGGSGLLAIGVFAAALVIGPRAKRSALGEQPRTRVPYRALGVVLGGLAAAPYLLAIVLASSNAAFVILQAAPTLCAFGLILFDSARYCFYLADRNARPSVTEAERVDSRPPVLFLRAFGIDEARVRVGRRLMTFEELIGPSIHRHVGPFIAIGNPADYVVSGGALKSYQRDETWQDYVVTTAKRAACVVVAEGVTAGLSWELTMLRRTLSPERIYFVTLPAEFRGRSTNPWNRFCVQLMDAGFGVKIDPPPGSLLACDKSWQVVVAESEHDEIGPALAEKVAGAHVLPSEVSDETLRWLVGRQGAPAPFASSIWRYLIVSYVGTVVIALFVALLG